MNERRNRVYCNLNPPLCNHKRVRCTVWFCGPARDNSKTYYLLRHHRRFPNRQPAKSMPTYRINLATSQPPCNSEPVTKKPQILPRRFLTRKPLRSIPKYLIDLCTEITTDELTTYFNGYTYATYMSFHQITTSLNVKLLAFRMFTNEWLIYTFLHKGMQFKFITLA